MQARADSPPTRAGGRMAQRTSGKWVHGAHRVALMRIGFGLIWAIDAFYKWRPGFLKDFSGQFHTQGTPAAILPWLNFWKNLLTPHATFFAVCTALLETVIAACLILGLGRRTIYAIGAVLSFLIWAVPETFGRIWQSGQTDMGTSIIYMFIFLALLVVDAGANAGGWSLDRRLEARLPWWRRLAEFAGPHA